MNRLVKKIGIELEMPLVKQNYLAADFDDAKKLFLDFSTQGWIKKNDPNTGALIGVKRETPNGLEMLSNELAVCVLEASLAPVYSLNEAISYWRNFKSSVLLPTVEKNNLKILGYGTQPISCELKDLITQKGYYQIWVNMVEEDCKEWILQNFPGICSVQFNFEIPKEKTIEILNTFLQLLAFLWAASANDSILAGQKLPYKSQRFHAYSTLNRGRMYGRSGLPFKPYLSLCDYINRTWDLPLFEIMRDGECLYPKNLYLTGNQFIREGSAEFYNLEGQLSQQKINLNDLELAIYFCWLDFRLKFNFHQGIKLEELVNAVYTDNEQKLLDLIDYIVFEVRPLAMQANDEEISWLVLTYLILENLEPVTQYSQKWTYEDVKLAAFAAQNNGLRQNLNDKTLGQIGLDLLKLIHTNSSQKYEPYLSQLHSRLSDHCSLADDAIRILDNDGIEALLDHLTIRQA